METTIKTPYELCIEEFGGVRELARQIGRDAGSVSKWKRQGTIPTSIQKKLLNLLVSLWNQYFLCLLEMILTINFCGKI